MTDLPDRLCVDPDSPFHDALIEAKGRYFALWSQQAQLSSGAGSAADASNAAVEAPGAAGAPAVAPAAAEAPAKTPT